MLKQSMALFGFPLGVLAYMLGLFAADAALPPPLNIIVEIAMAAGVVLFAMEATGRYYSSRGRNE